jgi:methylated-DNA-[protein]-cysteine S-methyltransferase
MKPMTATLPETFTIDRIPAPIGALLIATDAEGRLRAVDFFDDEAGFRSLIARTYGRVTAVRGAAPEKIRKAFERYFAGETAALKEVPWAASGTPFQLKVWKALTTIPPGETLSYGALAARIDEPKAMRAVGLANGANPIPIVVPCHRVIGADGSLTGFGGGLDRKRWLLRHEGSPFKENRASRRLEPELKFGEARV